jgi:hypothetical protein
VLHLQVSFFTANLLAYSKVFLQESFAAAIMIDQGD